MQSTCRATQKRKASVEDVIFHAAKDKLSKDFYEVVVTGSTAQIFQKALGLSKSLDCEDLGELVCSFKVINHTNLTPVYLDFSRRGELEADVRKLYRYIENNFPEIVGQNNIVFRHVESPCIGYFCSGGVTNEYVLIKHKELEEYLDHQ